MSNNVNTTFLEHLVDSIEYDDRYRVIEVDTDHITIWDKETQQCTMRLLGQQHDEYISWTN